MARRRQNRRAGRYGTSRPCEIRRTLPVVTVVCDDARTAVAYFAELKRETKTKVTVSVEPAPRSGATAADVLMHARELIEAQSPLEEGDSAWVLLDMETEGHRRSQARQVQQQAVGTEVTVLLSDPCYEIWTLAHLVDTGQSFKDCAEVLHRVKTEWRSRFGVDFGDKKAQAEYSRLTPLRNEAINNAKRRNPERDGSWTEVYRVVEAILSLYART